MRHIYTLANIQKIKWGFLEENKPIHLYPIMYPGWCDIIQKTGRILGKPQKSIICLHQGNSGKIFGDHKEWTALGVFILKKILNNPPFAINLNRAILKLSDQLVDFTKKNIFQANLKAKTNKQLINLYQEHSRRHGELYCRAIIPVYLEFYKPHLTKYLIDYLGQQIKLKNYHKTAKECFALLTVPKQSSQAQLEEQAWRRIAKNIFSDTKARRLFANKLSIITQKWQSLDKPLAKMIEKHINQYRCLGYNFEGPAFPNVYFLRRWQEVIRRKIDPIILLIAMEKKRVGILRLQEKLVADLKIDKKHQTLFTIARDIIYGKDYRKMSLVKSYYELEPLLREIGRRLKLNLNEVRNCLIVELEKMLLKNTPHPKDLGKRMKRCLFVVINQQLPGRIFTDEMFVQMKNYLDRKEDLSEINYFHGQTAATGKARGVVKIINSVKDLPKMKVGDILVSQMTNPDLLPAMKKAAAIITDQGGITCHAAIISRELGIPCVIGTKIATKALKDGDQVFVDADQGEIKRIMPN